MNNPYPNHVLHIVRSKTIGGSIRSALSQAQAETTLGRQVNAWVWLQEQKQEFDLLAQKYNLSVQRVTGLQLALGLLNTRLSLQPKQDIINFHTGLGRISPRLQYFRKAIDPRIPFILTLRGPTAYEPHTETAWRQQQLANSQFVSAIVTLSDSERQVQLDAGIPAEKVFVVPNVMEPKQTPKGILRDRLSLAPDTPIVLFCGRITTRKSPVQTIQAFQQVLPQYPNAILVVAGDGNLMNKCQEEARDLRDAVRFLGYVDDVDSLFADADVFVGPSTAESFGRTATEAALAKTPMVLGRIRPWTDEFVEGRDCEFVDPQDPKDIARGILKLLADPLKAQQQAESACQIALSRFGREAALAALTKAYKYAAVSLASRS